MHIFKVDLILKVKLFIFFLLRNVGRNFVWIGSDAWASRESVVYGREDVVEGAIAIQPLRLKDFLGYMAYDYHSSLRPSIGPSHFTLV